MENLLKIAAKELGITEISGAEDSDRIMQYSEDIGLDWVEADEVPWCSIFMNWIAMETGFERTDSGLARSWLNVGFPVENPQPGDVVIYWRESMESQKGHVGLFLGYSKDQSKIYTLGGNQGDSVSVSAYPTERVLGFRRLTKEEAISLPDVVLENGDSGQAVVQLQDALKLAHFDAGTSDGIFGPITEAAVKQLQTTNADLEVSGVFDESSREYLTELVNTA